MTLFTVEIMKCLMVNGMLFCAEPVKTREEFSFHKFETLKSIQYRFAKDLEPGTIAKMIYNGKSKIDGDLMSGCEITIKPGQIEFYEFPCSFLRKILK